MQSVTDMFVQRLADSCVQDMGDIFWDYDSTRDTPLGFVDPRERATRSIAESLQSLAAVLDDSSVYTSSVRLEYQELVASVGEPAADSDIVAELKSRASWDENGAKVILFLARQYGTSVLRTALALAEALNIEDGDAGL